MNRARKNMQRVCNSFKSATRSNRYVKFDVGYADEIERLAREAYQEESVSWWHGFWVGFLVPSAIFFSLTVLRWLI